MYTINEFVYCIIFVPANNKQYKQLITVAFILQIILIKNQMTSCRLEIQCWGKNDRERALGFVIRSLRLALHASCSDN